MNLLQTLTSKEDAERAVARKLWLESRLSQRQIAAKCGRSIGWLQNMARRLGWPPRKAVSTGRPSTKVKPDRAALDRKLHGDLADDVVFLRDRMGFDVGRYKGNYAVNNEVMSPAALRALAIDWRRRKGVAIDTSGTQPATARE